VSRVQVRTGLHLEPDPARVVARLFLPGQEFAGTEDPKRTGVAARVLGLSERAVDEALADVMGRFSSQNDDLEETLRHHGEVIADRVHAASSLTPNRMMLLGAAFTNEQSIEAAALCNPSMVAHPEQADAPDGGLRFIMSVRGIAEGHRSSIGFRTGSVDRRGTVTVDPADPRPVAGAVGRGPFNKSTFHAHLRELGQDGEGATSVLEELDEQFTADELDRELHRLRGRRGNSRAANHSADRLWQFSERSFSSRFADDVDVSRRVLLSATPAESHGVEDARFVRFTDDDGADPVYLATYTAYDGHVVAQQLLETLDFERFRSSPLLGPAAANKGLAIFPRRIGGRYVALSRHDRESNFVAFSDDLHWWGEPVRLDTPREVWETVQVGNCGAPIETPAGWLVLTHGVGLMRTYSIGALLLDLDDPTRVVGRLDEPLIATTPDVRGGYVPNVVYSCGALLHDGTLVVPYGIADSSIGVATVLLDELLDALVSD